MRFARCAVVILVAGCVLSAAGRAEAQVCLPTFGYGNVGYSAGYSFQQVAWGGPRWGGWGGRRWGWGGGWCGPRWGGWGGPAWGGWGGWGCRPWGWRRWCAAPVYGYGGYGYSCGWPASVGTTWFPSCNSVWMGAPFGGSFFSGSMVPYPTIGYPVVVPGFVSSNQVAPVVASLAASRPRVPPAQQLVATIRDLRARRDAAVVAAAPRGSNAASRLRAARQVAIGDRHLRQANGDPGELRRAVDAYRRAAAIAGDQPDTFVRQAIALVALGDRGQADAAMARAAALDGRLASTPNRSAGPPDPVFGDRPAGSPSPLAARGQAILRQVATQGDDAAADEPPLLARVAARWTERFGAVPATVARR